MDSNHKMYTTLLRRGLRKRCPQCGVGKLFERWYTVHDSCHHCRLDFVANQSNTWAFMYISTACLTGLIVAGMIFFRPENLVLGRTAIVILAIMFIVFTLPHRKGVATAIEYLIELKWGHNRNLRFQHPQDTNYKPNND